MRASSGRVVLVMAALVAVGTLASVGNAQTVADQVIAREKASFEAWQKMDRAFFEALFADGATVFMPENPYLEVDPMVTMLPRLDEWFERYKFRDFTMYNPRVQVYGDVAILTYNESIDGSKDGADFHYTGKVTSVYVKVDGVWRAAHSHESVNPGSH